MNWFIEKISLLFKPTYELFVTFDSSNKSKPTIVILHGIASNSNSWTGLINEFDSKKYRIITLDLLGCGKSPKPKDCQYTVDDHVASIRKTLKKLKVKKPFKLVGHSMGAIISARYCSLFPSDVSELFLLSLPLYLKNHDQQTKFANKRTDLYFKAYYYLSQNKKFTITNAAILRKLLRSDDYFDVTEETWDSFRLSLINTIVGQNTFADIKRIKLPIRIIFGVLDEFLVQESIDKLSVFDNVSITRLQAVDHVMSSKFAKEVARQVTG